MNPDDAKITMTKEAEAHLKRASEEMAREFLDEVLGALGKEREACARIADDVARECHSEVTAAVAESIATRIRARSTRIRTRFS